MPQRAVLRQMIGGGKVTIPKHVREDLELEVGDDVYLTVQPADEVTA